MIIMKLSSTRKILTSEKSSRILVITCWLIYMIAYLTRNTYAASIVHLTGDGLITTSMAGLVSTCYFISYGSGHLINGILADRVSPVPMLGIGIIGTAVANLLMPLVIPSVPLMIVVWTANGFFESMLWAPIVVLLSGVIAEKLRYSSIAAISSSRPTGQILAYLFSALCSYLGVGFKVSFIIAAICAVLSCVLLAVVSSAAFSAPDVQIVEIRPKEKKEKDRSTSILHLMAASGALIFLLPVVFHGMLKDGVNTWVPTILRDTFDASATLSTVLAIILPLAGLMGVLFGNFLLGRKRLLGNHPLIGIIIMLITAIPTALLLQAKALTLLVGVICLCLISFLMESFNHVFSVMMPAQFATFGKAATVSGIINSLVYIGSAISTYAFGAVAEQVGWSMTTLMWLALALTAAVILTFAIKPWMRFMQKKEG